MNLTKSHFLAYLSSPRHLWAKVNGKLDQKEQSEFSKHLTEQGYVVENLANKYIRDYLQNEYKVEDDKVLYQPSKVDGRFEARTDVLIFNPINCKWDMYEIKSSSSVKKDNKYDATFQYLVFNKYYDLGEIFILHLDKNYVRNGELNLNLLFKASNITQEVKELVTEVNTQRYKALEVLETDSIEGLEKCRNPKDCISLEVCHPDLPEYSIYNIIRLTQNSKKISELEEKGIRSIYDVPKDYELSGKQRRQVDAVQNDQVLIDKEAIRRELEGLKYPLYFVDYETYNPAIPLYNGFRPNMHVPFQWSLHLVENPRGEVKHYEFLHTSNNDPIPAFVRGLMNIISPEGTSIVWFKPFESGRNGDMAEIHPEFKEFLYSMNLRMYDLMDIFSKQYYLDPSFKGSSSIKKVLPVLCPHLSYKDLDIGNGSQAMSGWKQLVFGGLNEDERIKLKDDLLKYCKLDTLAMLEIFNRLMKEIK